MSPRRSCWVLHETTWISCGIPTLWRIWNDTKLYQRLITWSLLVLDWCSEHCHKQNVFIAISAYHLWNYNTRPHFSTVYNKILVLMLCINIFFRYVWLQNGNILTDESPMWDPNHPDVLPNRHCVLHTYITSFLINYKCSGYAYPICEMYWWF